MHLNTILNLSFQWSQIVKTMKPICVVSRGNSFFLFTFLAFGKFVTVSYKTKQTLATSAVFLLKIHKKHLLFNA